MTRRPSVPPACRWKGDRHSGKQEMIVSEDQLALAAALAGVATVDLGGAGAGQYLRRGLATATGDGFGSVDAAWPDRAGGTPDDKPADGI